MMDISAEIKKMATHHVPSDFIKFSLTQCCKFIQEQRNRTETLQSVFSSEDFTSGLAPIRKLST